MGALALREKLLLYPAKRVRGLKPGPVGVVFQSGGTFQFWLQQASLRGLDFSYAVSSGNELDLDLADYISFLVEDEHTKIISCMVEGIRRPKAFMAAAEKALAAMNAFGRRMPSTMQEMILVFVLDQESPIEIEFVAARHRVGEVRPRSDALVQQMRDCHGRLGPRAHFGRDRAELYARRAHLGPEMRSPCSDSARRVAASASASLRLSVDQRAFAACATASVSTTRTVRWPVSATTRNSEFLPASD